jgi:hypothetical protein
MIGPKSDNPQPISFVFECAYRADTDFSIDYSVYGDTFCPRCAAAD